MILTTYFAMYAFLLTTSTPQYTDSIIATVYSYNSEVGQTDSTQDITASGHVLREGDRVVANNCLRFGTRIWVQGYGEYIVLDRMNRRYNCSVFDVWSADKEWSKQFGKRRLTIEIY